MRLEWYCSLNPDGFWPKLANSAFGPYTPCVNSSVNSFSHLVLCIICLYRIWLIKYSVKAQKFRVRSSFYYYVMVFLAGYCVAVPLLRLAMKVSVFNLDGLIGLPPFEIVSLAVEALAWCSMLIKIGLETKVNVRQHQWYVLFGVVYCVLGEGKMLILVLPASNHHVSLLLYACISKLLCQILLGCLLIVHTPSLDPNPGYVKLESVSHDSGECKEISREKIICPERIANLFSRISFGWVTPLMQQGYNQPIAGKDVWQLDSWDQTETLIEKFQRCWAEESMRPKARLVRAMVNSFGKRLLLAWSWKIGFDLRQLLGPILLNHLLQSMQRGEPSWVGHVYAFSIFLGLLFGTICECQFYQNFMRVGLWVRSSLVAAIFRKSLRLTHGSRKNFPSGKITNLITTDVTAIQEMSQQLHGLWSVPFRIILCMVLLYQQLGVASLLGTLILALMIPIQTLIIRNLGILKKQGVQKTDNRVSLMNEVLTAMETVKFYAWEESFRCRIQNIRDDELSWFRSAQFLSAFNSFILSSIPAVVTLVTFGAFTFLGGNLTPARAFTSLSLFQVLEFPLSMLPNLFNQVVNANVSVQRLEELLLSEQRNLAQNPPLEPRFPAISIKNGYFSWDSKADIPTLSNINLDIPVGSLVAIVGGTGEGKTSLLSAILGDLPPATDASVIVRGTVAYVPQISWIFNATLRDNVLFGSEYEATRYWRAIHATALQHDLDSFPGHDLTEIGEKGVNISGGQRQRVSMARAVYSDSDVYIFDDPLSALDANVGREVFNSCIKNALQGKTRILVTNQLHFLQHVDRIILMCEGMIKEEGTFEELSKCGKLFQKLMENAGKINKLEEQAEVPEDVNIQSENLNTLAGSMEEPAKYSGYTEKEKGSKSVLITEEERKTGTVSWNVLMRYKNGLGGMWIILILFTSCLSTMLRVSSSAWLSFWTKQSNSESYRPGYYILVYALLSLSQVTGELGSSYWLIIASLRAARRLHELMLDSVLRAPMLFFHTNPTGRIINRFSKDLGDIDHNVPNLGYTFITCVWQLLAIFVLIGLISTISLWAIMPLLVLFYANYLYFQSTIREVRRLESITRSPVYAQFAEALTGLSSIRAYKAYDWIAKINGNSMDDHNRFILARYGLNNWLTMRMGTIGGFVIWITAAFAVMQNGGTESQVASASMMGLVLAYTLKITVLVDDALIQASKTEMSLNSVERIGTYIDLPSEAPDTNDTDPPPPVWPSSGFTEFRDVVLRYRPELPPVLHGISFTVSPCEKLGIVGRTGAGKSSLLNALFRIVEIERGAIVIDGFDITRIGLTDLRKGLSIIPQSPVLFSGTVQFNLDPFNQYSEADLWEALARVHLKEVIWRNSSGLHAMVSEGGENFSVGQRQLLSLARALLKRSKILVLDEATAAIDVKTDDLVQKTIREEFRSCTMLVVAHRLNTIIDCDKILVLHAGQIVEHAGTQELLSNEESAFSRMVQSTGSGNAQYLRSLVFERIGMKHRSQEETMKQDGLKRRVVSSR